jgi:site-specific DNA-methyltransferase (adenine-specific)
MKIDLLHGDCLELMKTIPDKSIDMVLTDPPYGINIAEWDHSPIGLDFINEMKRVSKNQIIFGGNFFDLPKTESWIIWYKEPFLKKQAQCEMIWTSLKFKPRVFHYRYAGNCEGYPGKLKVDYKKKSSHPTQKPIELMEYLVKEFTEEGDTVLDCFMGSGSTGVACKNLNRNFIGIEKDDKYFEIAKKRIEGSI